MIMFNLLLKKMRNWKGNVIKSFSKSTSYKVLRMAARILWTVDSVFTPTTLQK